MRVRLCATVDLLTVNLLVCMPDSRLEKDLWDLLASLAGDGFSAFTLG